MTQLPDPATAPDLDAAHQEIARLTLAHRGVSDQYRVLRAEWEHERAAWGAERARLVTALEQIEQATRHVNSRRGQRSRLIHDTAAKALAAGFDLDMETAVLPRQQIEERARLVARAKRWKDAAKVERAAHSTMLRLYVKAAVADVSGRMERNALRATADALAAALVRIATETAPWSRTGGSPRVYTIASEAEAAYRRLVVAGTAADGGT